MIEVGQKLKTRDGRDARILCVDFDNVYPVVAAVMCFENEVIYFYNKDGKIKDIETHIDLMTEEVC